MLDVRFGVDSLFERVAKLIHFAVMITFAIIGTKFDPSSPHETYSTMRQLSLCLFVSRLVLIAQYGSVMLCLGQGTQEDYNAAFDPHNRVCNRSCSLLRVFLHVQCAFLRTNLHRLVHRSHHGGPGGLHQLEPMAECQLPTHQSK